MFVLLFLSCSSEDGTKPETNNKKDRTPTHKANLEGMVFIPQGQFIMGSNEIPPKNRQSIQGEKPWFLDEHPKKQIYLKAYLIDTFEITNVQYWKTYKEHSYPTNQKKNPVTNVSWFDAEEYCQKNGKRLPTEEEWEKAARGTDGRQFPWGNTFDATMANMEMSGIGHAVPSGTILTDRSVFTIYDLAGNVAEWTGSWYKAYSGSDYKSDKFGKKYRVIRGNSWAQGGHYTKKHYARSAYRLPSSPHLKFDTIGFRCAKTTSQEHYTSYTKMTKIPSGPFVMGSNKKDNGKRKQEIGTRRPLYVDESPEKIVHIKSFYIDTFEVTEQEYRLFNPKYPYRKNRGNHPVTMVTWKEASHYCRWRGKRLPTEKEWEKAARGENGREFPWGDTFDKTRLNHSEKGTFPVGFYDEGKSPYGVYDMAGNVWEWTNNWYEQYKGSDYASEDFGKKYKVARGGGHGGGGHYSLSAFVRSAHRLPLPIDFQGDDTGFRCVTE